MATLQVTLSMNALPNVPAPVQTTPSSHETVYDPTAGVTQVDFFLVGTALTLMTLVGTFFNGMSIAVFCKYRDLRSPTNTFILSLCTCDFFMSAIGSPIPAYHSFRQTYIRSKLVCDIDAFAVYFLGCTSLYLLAAISVDRYLVIVKPISDFVVTQRAANLAVAVCVTWGFLWALFPLLGWNEYIHEGIGVACSITWHKQDVKNKSYIICVFLFCFIFPFCVMLFCYLKIARTVKQIFNETGVTSSRKHALIENKLLQTIIIMIVVFLVSWIPYVVIGFAEAFGGGMRLSPLVATIPALIAKASCVWNPIIYVAMNANFRMGFISLFPIARICFPQPSSNAQVVDSTAMPTVRGGGSSGVNANTDPQIGAQGDDKGHLSNAGGTSRARLSPEREERRTSQRCSQANSSLALKSPPQGTKDADTLKHDLSPKGEIDRKVSGGNLEESGIDTCYGSDCIEPARYSLTNDDRQHCLPTQDEHDIQALNINGDTHQLGDMSAQNQVRINDNSQDSYPLNERSTNISDQYTHEEAFHATQRSIV
ncbi:melanopsin [Plakobranchus ocellatus]|uniref:Melanopsin n=1 Tax=Plakobranchus ocellatus TaxID=259542 RepID=A0AAV3Y696_9GAST|nr:melanopsin [Plakobranchus ocellatus]